MKTVHVSVLPIFFVLANGKNVTLTTATVRDSDCLKPTSLTRKIQIDRRRTEDSRSTPLNIFRTNDHKMRNRSEIWKWDYWCQLQPKIGSCPKALERFYYDSQLDRCLTFTYSGCNGNKNNFDSLAGCESHCKGAASMDVKEIESTMLCSLQPNAGLCIAMFTKYYYDVNGGTCKRFIYGGCGGNDNRFNTKYKCLKRCHRSE